MLLKLLESWEMLLKLIGELRDAAEVDWRSSWEMLLKLIGESWEMLLKFIGELRDAAEVDWRELRVDLWNLMVAVHIVATPLSLYTTCWCRCEHSTWIWLAYCLGWCHSNRCENSTYLNLIGLLSWMMSQWHVWKYIKYLNLHWPTVLDDVTVTGV